MAKNLGAHRNPIRVIGRVILRPGMMTVQQGSAVENRDAVTPACRLPVDAISAELGCAGSRVLESHMRTTAGWRPPSGGQRSMQG